MSEIKFRCGECEQKIAVDAAAAGVQIDCPYCKSGLVIPASADAEVVMVTRRKMAVLATAGPAAPTDSLNEAISAKQDLADALRQRDELTIKMTALAPLREQLEKAERDLEHARNESVTSTKDRDILSESATRMQKMLRGLADSAPKGGIPPKEVHTLLEKMATFDRERADMNATLTEVYSSAGSKWDEQQKQLDRQRDQLATITMERDSLKLNVSKAIGEIEALRGESSKAASDFKKASEQILELNEAVASLKRERDELRTKADSVEGLPNELAAAREEASKVRAQYNELTRMLESAKLDCDQARTLASERERALEKMGAAMDGAKAELAKLREEASAGAAERERFKASSEEFNEESRELQQRVDSLLEELHARERELSEANITVSSARQRADSQEVALLDVREKLEVATSRLAARELEAREAIARLGTARETGQEAQLRLEQAERIASASTEKIRITEEDRTRNAEQLARVTSELGTLHEQLKQARVEKEQNRSKVIELQSEMERHYDALHAIEAERDTMRRDLETVKTGLDRAKQHVNVLQARRDVMREEINRLRTKLGLPPDTHSA